MLKLRAFENKNGVGVEFIQNALIRLMIGQNSFFKIIYFK